MKYISTSALLLVYIFSFAQGDILRSKRIASIIKVDGDVSEWNLPIRFYDKDTKLFFDFANDENNLYLCFQSNDNAERMKIMRAGMTVTIKIKGGDKASIKFPLGQTAEDKNMMEVKGFKTKDGIISIKDNSGINAAVSHENQELVYEISIPLKELSGDDFKKDFDKDIELAVEVHPIKQNGSGGEKNYSGREGGGGGMHRGGMNGGGKSGMQHSEQDGNQEPKEDRSAMFEKTEFKQKFTLAKQ